MTRDALRHRAALVAVCGASDATPEEIAIAERVGRMLAERGVIVVCGGLGGVMEGACRGVSAGGGTSVALLPGDDPAAANPHATVCLATGLGEMRNALIARVARAMIAVGGGVGTLSEIALMLRIGRPVCAVSSWEISPPHGGSPPIHRAADAGSAVTWVMDRL